MTDAEVQTMKEHFYKLGWGQNETMWKCWNQALDYLAEKLRSESEPVVFVTSNSKLGLYIESCSGAPLNSDILPQGTKLYLHPQAEGKMLVDAERYRWIMKQAVLMDAIFAYTKSNERHVSNAIDKPTMLLAKEK